MVKMDRGQEAYYNVTKSIFLDATIRVVILEIAK